MRQVLPLHDDCVCVGGGVGKSLNTAEGGHTRFDVVSAQDTSVLAMVKGGAKRFDPFKGGGGGTTSFILSREGGITNSPNSSCMALIDSPHLFPLSQTSICLLPSNILQFS